MKEVRRVVQSTLSHKTMGRGGGTLYNGLYGEDLGAEPPHIKFSRVTPHPHPLKIENKKTVRWTSMQGRPRQTVSTAQRSKPRICVMHMHTCQPPEYKNLETSRNLWIVRMSFSTMSGMNTLRKSPEGLSNVPHVSWLEQLYLPYCPI